MTSIPLGTPNVFAAQPRSPAWGRPSAAAPGYW